MHDPKTLSFGRTAFLIETLFGLENDLVIHNACWDLPVREGLKILRSDPKFTSFKNFPLFEWVCSARTAKTRSLREDIALYSCNPGASEFRSLADIARKHGLTRSATSKAYRQMMSQNSGDLFNARGRSDKARKTMSVAALRSWQARRQAA